MLRLLGEERLHSEFVRLLFLQAHRELQELSFRKPTVAEQWPVPLHPYGVLLTEGIIHGR
jgi:hypothetical protein